MCGATIRYILLNHPSSVPKDFFANVSYHHRHKPSLEDYRELTDKGRLVTDDGICRLVRKPTKTPVSSNRPGGRAARLLNDEPTRIYVRMLMRPWVMQACHANALCHLGTARTLSLLERFYWWIGMRISTRWWIRRCLKCQARKTARQTIRWPILTIPLPSAPGIAISVDYFGPLPTTPRGFSHILLFTDRFSRRANMYAVTDAEFTAEGTADVLVNKYMPVWG